MKKVYFDRLRPAAVRYIASFFVILIVIAAGMFFGDRSKASSPSSGVIGDTVKSSSAPWMGDRVTPGYGRQWRAQLHNGRRVSGQL